MYIYIHHTHTHTHHTHTHIRACTHARTHAFTLEHKTHEHVQAHMHASSHTHMHAVFGGSSERVAGCGRRKTLWKHCPGHLSFRKGGEMCTCPCMRMLGCRDECASMHASVRACIHVKIYTHRSTVAGRSGPLHISDTRSSSRCGNAESKTWR